MTTDRYTTEQRDRINELTLDELDQVAGGWAIMPTIVLGTSGGSVTNALKAMGEALRTVSRA
jgi:hypothetical protein